MTFYPVVGINTPPIPPEGHPGVGKDAEVRPARDRKPWAPFPVAVDAKTDREAPATWVRVALFGDAVAAVAPRFLKGTEVYCKGRLTLGTWGRDGEARAWLHLALWEVQPMGQVGRRKPKVRPRHEQGAVPFDDELSF